MTYVGIDPGLTGCVCILKPNVEWGIEFFDTPTVKIKVGKSLKSQMDLAACALLLSALEQVTRSEVLVTIEKVAPMPSFNRDKEGEQIGESRTMGVSSAFNFGMGFGIWQGVVAALRLPFQLVHPATWKAKLMRDMQKGKDASRIKAMQLYPDTARELSRQKDHGRADALLLAHYAYVTRIEQARAPVAKPSKRDEFMEDLF